MEHSIGMVPKLGGSGGMPPRKIKNLVQFGAFCWIFGFSIKAHIHIKVIGKL